MRRDTSGEFHSRVPLSHGTEAYTLSYYVEVLAPSGAALSTLGTAEAPLSLSVPEAIAIDPTVITERVVVRETAAGGNVAEEWWFWTIIGVVVAGGVAGGLGWYFTAPQPVQPGSLGGGDL